MGAPQGPRHGDGRGYYDTNETDLRGATVR
jgi:hypothetical protein